MPEEESSPEDEIGRRKGYDRDAVITGAMVLFREHGFAGTTAEMLVESLGISRHGLYAEFGSKQGLFEAALRRYDAQVVERNFGPLEQSGAGVEEIRALLAFFGDASDGPASGRGCLLCNTAVEFGPDDPTGAGFVQRYFERISKAFALALANGRARGELRQDVDPRAEAAFFTAAVLGMFVMLRAKAPTQVIEDASRRAIAHLQGLSSARSG